MILVLALPSSSTLKSYFIYFENYSKKFLEFHFDLVTKSQVSDISNNYQAIVTLNELHSTFVVCM